LISAPGRVTSDRSLTWSNSAAPTDYVSASRQIRFRVRRTSTSSFRTRTDLVRFLVDY
jgi:hypothetical protein